MDWRHTANPLLFQYLCQRRWMNKDVLLRLFTFYLLRGGSPVDTIAIAAVSGLLSFLTVYKP